MSAYHVDHLCKLAFHDRLKDILFVQSFLYAVHFYLAPYDRFLDVLVFHVLQILFELFERIRRDRAGAGAYARKADIRPGGVIICFRRGIFGREGVYLPVGDLPLAEKRFSPRVQAVAYAGELVAGVDAGARPFGLAEVFHPFHKIGFLTVYGVFCPIRVLRHPCVIHGCIIRWGAGGQHRQVHRLVVRLGFGFFRQVTPVTGRYSALTQGCGCRVKRFLRQHILVLEVAHVLPHNIDDLHGLDHFLIPVKVGHARVTYIHQYLFHLVQLSLPGRDTVIDGIHLFFCFVRIFFRRFFCQIERLRGDLAFHGGDADGGIPGAVVINDLDVFLARRIPGPFPVVLRCRIIRVENILTVFKFRLGAFYSVRERRACRGIRARQGIDLRYDAGLRLRYVFPRRLGADGLVDAVGDPFDIVTSLHYGRCGTRQVQVAGPGRAVGRVKDPVDGRSQVFRHSGEKAAVLYQAFRVIVTAACGVSGGIELVIQEIVTRVLEQGALHGIVAFFQLCHVFFGSGFFRFRRFLGFQGRDLLAVQVSHVFRNARVGYGRGGIAHVRVPFLGYQQSVNSFAVLPVRGVQLLS